MTPFKYAFVPGLFWGFFVGMILGGACMTFAGNAALESSAKMYRERGQLEQLCIGGNDGACRVLEARK